MAEAVGLALAVFPLLILAADHYREGLDSMQMLHPKTGDDRILEFYEEVVFEMFLLRNCIKKLVKDLPGFSMEYKRGLLKSLAPESWNDEALSSALQTKLGEINYSMFELTLRRLLASLNALLSSNQKLLKSHEAIDENTFCARLSVLRKDMVAGKTLSTLRSRVQFTTSQQKRTKYLERITKYNERLQKLLEVTTHADVTEFDIQAKGPSPNLRTIAHTLHQTLSRCWSCNCKAPHIEELVEAKLCLNRDNDFRNTFECSFDIIFTTQSEKNPSWHETVVHAAPKVKPASKAQIKQVETICELIKGTRGHDICLQMLLDDQKLWQVRPQSKRLQPGRNISLDAVLHGSTTLRLREKRVLAVSLAQIVLQLSEGPWLRKRWSPAEISFFETAQSAINFQNPYLSTQFDDPPPDYEFEAQSIHAIPSLLFLGKLLIEIDQGKPVEITPLDLTEGKFPNANTELTATMRSFKEASGDFYVDYTKAIRACLEPTFLRWDQTGGLEDEEIRQQVYEHVVVPLETELYNGFNVRIPTV